MIVTMQLDANLHARLLERARETGLSVDALVQRALQSMLDAPREPRDLPALPTFEGSGVWPGIDLTDNANVADALDGLRT